jgi:hypothetical protein
MAAGIVAVVIIGVVMLALNAFAQAAAYQKGYRRGMVDEGAHWFDALESIKPPNWQSLPDPEGVDKKESEAYRKVYVDTFKVALATVKSEIIMTRFEALKQQVLKSIENA